jgi:hypothetical protein
MLAQDCALPCVGRLSTREDTGSAYGALHGGRHNRPAFFAAARPRLSMTALPIAACGRRLPGGPHLPG